MAMFQRRRVASTSSLVAWCVGAGSLDPCGSSSARAETSHTVTGRPPSATLAWRRISRLPSTNGSRCVTEAPTRTPCPWRPAAVAAAGHKNDPGIVGAHPTYATNCTVRQVTALSDFARGSDRTYSSLLSLCYVVPQGATTPDDARRRPDRTPPPSTQSRAARPDPAD